MIVKFDCGCIGIEITHESRFLIIYECDTTDKGAFTMHYASIFMLKEPFTEWVLQKMRTLIKDGQNFKKLKNLLS